MEAGRQQIDRLNSLRAEIAVRDLLDELPTRLAQAIPDPDSPGKALMAGYLATFGAN
jgi:hypothetical protein